MTILGLAESFKTVDQLDPTRPDPARSDRDALLRQFVPLEIGIDNFDSLECMRLLTT